MQNISNRVKRVEFPKAFSHFYSNRFEYNGFRGNFYADEIFCNAIENLLHALQVCVSLHPDFLLIFSFPLLCELFKLS